MKKLLAILLIMCFVLPQSFGIVAFAASDVTLYLTAENFKSNLGTWKMSSDADSVSGECLLGLQGGSALPASATIEIPEDGTYYVWGRVKDFDDRPGIRFFHIAIGDTTLSETLGDPKIAGWSWDFAGQINLKKGASVVNVIDTSLFWARLDAVVITTNKDFKVPADKESVNKELSQYKVSPSTSANLPNTGSGAVSTPKVTPAPAKAQQSNAVFKEGKNYFAVTTSQITNLGSWVKETNNEALNKELIVGGINGTKAANPATFDFKAPSDNVYYIWAHTKDFVDKTAQRHFKIKIDSTELLNSVGVHGNDGWAWEKAGEIPLLPGDHVLSLLDTSGYYARWDLILITDDAAFTPPWEADKLKDMAEKYKYDASKVTVTQGIFDPDRPVDEIAVKFNGEYIIFDVPPVLENSRTLVPMRAIFEALGCTVKWNESTQTASGERNGNIVSVTIGSNNAQVNGAVTKLDQSAILKDSRTLVPLRFISEAFDAQVTWREDTKTVIIMANIPLQAFFIAAESFRDIGTWRIETTGTMGSTLIGTQPTAPPNNVPATIDHANPAAAKPAITMINVKKDGQYRIWAHARDFATNQQGTRFFDISINGVKAPKTFGQHGRDGFFWTDGGILDLKAGENEVKLIDSSGFYARCDGVFITADLNFVPPEDKNAILAIARPVDLLSELASPSFPMWARESYDSVKEDSIENDNVKVVFIQANSEKNGSFIQNEIYVKDSGQWIKVKDRTDEHGYLMLKAISSGVGGWIDGYMSFNQTIQYGDDVIKASTTNAYKSGFPVWMIPSDFEKTADNKIVLTFAGRDDADVTVTWELDHRPDPKVTLDASFKQEGSYSFALFSGNEYADEDYENALAPFRIMEKRVPQDPVVYFEHYLFTPMGSVTLPESNDVVSGKKLTTAIVVDPEWIPRGYVYRETSTFGVSMRGPSGGVRGNLFAPLFGSDYCNFESGEGYNISYRVVNKLDTWFETYKHITQNIYDVHDYRSNYYTSLNEAIYNTTDLMMDDDYGGWDPVDKAHYNMEEKDLTSVANPMIAVQRYLLTENDDILTQRAIPTLASLLTRERLHFKRFDTVGGASYLSGPKPTEIGEPISGYNLNVFGGLYEMSRGLMPDLLHIGLDKAGTVTNAYGNIPQFANDLSLYRYTGEEKYLKSAKEKADKYLEDVVYNEKFNSTLPNFTSFINISYYPNLASLIDIYQETKEQKYLDAAVKTGQMLATTVWVSGIDGAKGTDPYVIDPDKTLERKFMAAHQFWWHGSQQWRLGNNDGEAKPPAEGNYPLQGETVPGWLPSRVGLGLEQGSTFAEALNIYMNSWVGDMVKLSALSGEEYFETIARNAIIGRFGNYAGYYQNRYITHQMKPEYPYQGPDLTSIYWHHLPPFLAMLEDFLINQVWAKSQMNIEFPSVRQQGYAYFNSNQFGFESGKFYDQTGMWLWNDRGIIEPDSIQINYLPARKDGVLGVALMNEADTATTTTILLGEKVSGGSNYSGTATVYEANGAKSELKVENGKFTIEIPAKGIKSIVMKIPGVKAPAYSTEKYDVAGKDIGTTVAAHDRGMAYILQLTPGKYYAYVYVTDMPKDTKEMKVNYKIGDKSGTAIPPEYPFEVIIEVDDATKSFTYDIEITRTNASKETIKGNTLNPSDRFEKKVPAKPTSAPIVVSSELKDFDAFDVKVEHPGMGDGNIRFVVALTAFPFELSANILRGLRVTGTLTHKTDGSKLNLDAVIDGNEMREKQTVLVIKPTQEVPLFDYKDYNINLTIHPAK